MRRILLPVIVLFTLAVFIPLSVVAAARFGWRPRHWSGAMLTDAVAHNHPILYMGQAEGPATYWDPGRLPGTYLVLLTGFPWHMGFFVLAWIIVAGYLMWKTSPRGVNGSREPRGIR